MPRLPDVAEPVVELPPAPPEARSARLRNGPRRRTACIPLPGTDGADVGATESPIPQPAPEPEKVAEGEAQPGATLPPLDISEPLSDAERRARSTGGRGEAVRGSGSSRAAGRSRAQAEETPPRDDWRDGVERLRTVIRGHDGEPDGPWALRALLLDALARAGEGGDDANLWKTVLPALGATDEPKEPAERPRVDELRAAILALEDQAPLEITDLRLCKKVSGFGNFDPLDATSLKAGQAVIIYCELSGLRSEAQGDGYRSRLSSHYEVVPATGGEPVVKRTSLGAADDLCRRRRRDYYANYRVDLPRGLSPGSYELRLTQEDAIAGRTTSSAIPFTVLP